MLELFLAFLKIGLFTFGGAYASIPLIRDTAVIMHGWLSDELLSKMIAVSESTPGPIMVNIATYVGSERGGVLGAAAATLAVILPAFAVIVLLLCVFKRAEENKFVKAALSGVKPCVAGMILAVGVYMTAEKLLEKGSACSTISIFNTGAAAVFLLLAGLMIGYKTIKKKRISPIVLIIAAAALGLAVYGV